ncbi:HD domain-containing protein [Candidatus Thorarchaeota archaeon]|nr:MAG: HD domain-containing protein [Candidatus Thorarchaeota archaeon]
MKKDIETIEERVRELLQSSERGAHTYDHSLRVLKIALEIGQEEDANLKVVGAAALLHDIGRAEERETGISHAILSGEMARPILEEVGFSREEISLVIDAIRTHRFSEDLTPNTLEGEILSDADKLDAMGAIGAYRAIAQSAVTGVGIEGFLSHADEKLLRLNQLLHTPSGKALGKQRHRVLELLVDELRREVASTEGLTTPELSSIPDMRGE